MEDVVIRPGVVVPSTAMRFRAVRSAGPGGQNVNKVASRVELHVEVAAIRGLTTAAQARLHTLIGRRRDSEGRWLVTSQRTRDQRRNLDDALDKVRALVGRALIAPRSRRPTAPSAAARRARADAKRRRGRLKRDRGARAAPDD